MSGKECDPRSRNFRLWAPRFSVWKSNEVLGPGRGTRNWRRGEHEARNRAVVRKSPWLPPRKQPLRGRRRNRCALKLLPQHNENREECQLCRVKSEANFAGFARGASGRRSRLRKRGALCASGARCGPRPSRADEHRRGGAQRAAGSPVSAGQHRRSNRLLPTVSTRLWVAEGRVAPAPYARMAKRRLEVVDGGLLNREVVCGLRL